jgi:outer membrane autotransporter protein
LARSTLNGDSNVGLGPSELFQLVDLSLRWLPRCPFIEPLATIAFAWSNIDDFAIGGNAINFNDETNVRGRLGLRLGTSYQVWPGTTMEPFVIGSVWSTLSGKNEVTLTSTTTTFRLEDAPDE